MYSVIDEEEEDDDDDDDATNKLEFSSESLFGGILCGPDVDPAIKSNLVEGPRLARDPGVRKFIEDIFLTLDKGDGDLTDEGNGGGEVILY